MFIALGSVQVGICALTIPLCEFCPCTMRPFGHPPMYPVAVVWGPVYTQLTSHTADILGKKNRSFFHRHNVFFRATDALANGVLCVFAKGSQAVG